MRLFLFALLILIPFSVTALADSAPVAIPKETSPQLIEVLGNIEIIAERRGRAFFVRLYRLHSDRLHTECDGSPQTCPQQFIYLLISGYDEVPDQTLYRLPDAFGWQFREWSNDPANESEFVQFVLERQVVSTNTQLRWWDTELHEVSVNLSSAAIRLLPR